MTDITEVALPGNSFPAYQGETYAELATTAAVMPGGDLVKGDLLIGVPFAIIAMTFRTGNYMSAVTKVQGAYVSLEVISGDEKAFERARKRGRIDDDCPIDTNEMLVFNEGGTGVYRESVLAWEDMGWIKLPDGPEGGTYGASRLDTPIDQWEFTGGGLQLTVDGEGNTVAHASVRFLCPRGLRVSEYENDYTKEGRTRYFG